MGSGRNGTRSVPFSSVRMRFWRMATYIVYGSLFRKVVCDGCAEPDRKNFILRAFSGRMCLQRHFHGS